MGLLFGTGRGGAMWVSMANSVCTGTVIACMTFWGRGRSVNTLWFLPGTALGGGGGRDLLERGGGGGGEGGRGSRGEPPPPPLSERT